MAESQLKVALRDVAFTTTTPFDESDGAVDLSAHEENVAWLESQGAGLFLPCGNTGEYYSLTNEERIDVVHATVEATEDSVVIGGAGGSTKNVIELIEAYSDGGADAAMVMHPSHTYRHEQGLIEYYRSIVSAVDVPVVVYKRGPELSESVLAALTTLDGVAGVKYAVNDVEAFSKAIEASEGDVVWMNGIAERFAPAFALEGAEGFTTGIGNVLPRATLALRDAIEDADWERARSIRDAIRPLETLRQEAGAGNDLAGANNVPVVKHGMDHRGRYGGPVREPLVGLTDEDAARVERYTETVLDRVAFGD
jgi:4-hydroxy-tetrahydrodipicolinate synthase